jgi:hydroxypyruvate isomerase
MNRRTFLATGLAGAAASAGLAVTGRARAQAAVDVRSHAEGDASRQTGPTETNTAGRRGFKLKYAPHFGMFKHHAGEDLVDQLKFAVDQGFTAWEDNGMKGRSVEDQERIAKAMSELGIRMGVFVVDTDTAWRPSLATGKEEDRDVFLQACRDSVEVAKRVNAKWMTVVPGKVAPWLDAGYQTANVVEALRRGAEIFEPHGLVMVLEPLNFRDHPDLFLTKIAQAYEICRAVDSPACKILNDLYHQQVAQGNLIPNIDMAWDEIAYFQVGDNPGRKEPTTGEINYQNVFKHIHGKGFAGIVGMEHGIAGKGEEGERALLEAYRDVDSF